MIRKLKFIFVLLFSITLQSQVCSDFPEITATSTTLCSGLSTTLSVTYTPPTICNMNITPTTIPLGNPIPGFTYGGLYNGHHYYVYNTPTSWTQGELICRQNGGYLVCINDINENAYVSNLTNNNIWIGLFRDPITCQFRWLDCMDINFTNWRPGEPNSGPCGEPYTQIIRGCSFGLNTWNNLDDNSANGSCYSNMVPIMEIDPIIYNNPISPTTTYLWSTGETTNSINISPTSTTNYWVDITSGSLTCRKNITINVNPDTPAPTGNPTQVFCASPTPLISDLTATGTAIQWYAAATGGSPLASTTALVDGTTYHASQTINGCESTTRLAVTVDFNDPQITASETTICSGTTVSLSVNYDLFLNTENYSFFGEFEGHSYFISINPINYSLASNYNLTNGVDFLTITSQNENDFITSNSLPGFLWLGCSDLSLEGQWEWLNNENFNYSNWDIGEPNNQAGGEDYAEFKINGFWNDIPLIDNGNEVLRYHMFETSFSSSILWSTGEITQNINVNPTTTTTYWVDVTINGITCRKEIVINVSSTTVAPTGNSIQVFCVTPAPIVADLVAIGSNIKWYDSLTGGNLLYNTTNLIEGSTYYATQTINNCESDDRLAVTVNFNDPQIIASETNVCEGASITLTVSNPSTPITNNCSLPSNLQNGLVGYWPFCGNANDESGNGNNGTVNGATLTTDRFGNPNNAYYFSSSGCSTRIDAQVNTSSIQNELTISIWVLRVGNGCISPRILEFWPSANPNGPGMAQWGWGNNINTIGIGSITSTGFSCSAGIPVNGNDIWYNIVYTNDGTTGKFYRDGNLITSIPSSGNPILAGSAAFGRMNHPAFDNLNGKLDDIGVWNRALSQQEISQLNNYAQPTYLWSTGETTETINPTPTANTTYWVDVTVNGTTCRKEINIIVNPSITASFTQVSDICSGATLSSLPTTSDNGITGTWSPVLNNVATTTYTFTPDTGQCATTATMTINVNPSITPTFTQVADICSGATLSSLPTTSNNGISGTWSPALNNTATTTYTFTPDAGQCATTASMTIIVNQLLTPPTGDSQQNFCAINNPIISDLVLNSNFINWYLEPTGGTPLNSNYSLTDGLSLYAASYDPITNCENPSRYQVNIQVENPAPPFISPQQVFCLENNITIEELNTNGVNMIWYDSPVGGNTVLPTYILQNGDVVYGAAINSASGCESTTRIPLEISLINSNLEFNNLITIDNNDLNKELLIQGIEQFPNNNIEVYNRYGNLVWSGINYNNISNTFKGMANISGVVSKGSYLPTGTYFFILSYPNDCEKTELKGFIHIDNKL